MPTFKMASWNVNGLRACMTKGFKNFLDAHNFDIFGIQETKMQAEQADFEFPGYHVYWNSAEKKGYSGTCVLTKTEPLSVTKGIGVDIHDTEGRVLTLEYDSFYFITVYTPNSQRDLARLPYRETWEDAFRTYLLSLNKPVIICGDLNVAHQEIDLKNPKNNKNNAGFTMQERNKMTLLLNSGFTDTYRFLYPNQVDRYTWWSYMGNARTNNVGWRIDYFLTSNALQTKIQEAMIYPETLGSDHCPIGLIITI